MGNCKKGPDQSKESATWRQTTDCKVRRRLVRSSVKVSWIDRRWELRVSPQTVEGVRYLAAEKSSE
jgi:hypothetical protein